MSPKLSSDGTHPTPSKRSVSMFHGSPGASTAKTGISQDRSGPEMAGRTTASSAGCGERRNLSAKTRKLPPPLAQSGAESRTAETSAPGRGIPASMSGKASSALSSNSSSPVSSTSRLSSKTSATSDGAGHEPSKGSETQKGSKSSNALRESIAKAKAARKATRNDETKNTLVDPFEGLSIQDSFGQVPKTKDTKSVLRSRTSAARKSGRLNVSALGLKEIPRAVMAMYDSDPENSADWYESVDLAKFIAADNEIDSLSDVAFPDVDLTTVDVDEDVQGGQFGALEVLDVHGNVLADLPKGLRRLQRLRFLNLSSNQLSTGAFDVISEIEGLTELRMANNNLAGILPPAIERLRNLEVLDLRGNALAELPDTLGNLASLRVINVAENELSRLPFDAICDLPIREINVRKNRLSGYLIPSSVDRLSNLQVLNVSCNALDGLSERNNVDLPCLQQLYAETNRIGCLPDVSSWGELLTVNMEDNSLSEIPEGLSKLKNVKRIDFTGNGIRKLDDDIGLMDSLSSFRIANNPLIQQKFLKMDTDELKRELQSRCAPEMPDTEEEDGSVQTDFTLAPESPRNRSGWRVKPGGILDRSSTELSDLESSEFHSVALSSDIRCLYLRRNQFRSLPTSALSLIAHSLTDLDLSHNPLGRAALLSSPLTFPHLQSLTLTGCNLGSLEPLLEHLSAPLLAFLDVSNNHFAGPVPCVRSRYPNLLTFLAADNQFESLDFEAVKGLQVLDVSNNSIDSLPPRIGLLSTEEVRSGVTGLRRFDVAGNSFRVPRWQIVAKGTEAVLEWLRNRITDEEVEEWQQLG